MNKDQINSFNQITDVYRQHISNLAKHAQLTQSDLDAIVAVRAILNEVPPIMEWDFHIEDLEDKLQYQTTDSPYADELRDVLEYWRDLKQQQEQGS